jgi:cyclopropane fatty-acyl-phospholipid synthase-like methyltransferase
VAEAEILMMESYCTKAKLKDGQDVLDLGCGWGSLSLYLAQKYPKSRITGVSNSTTQKAHIDATAKARGFTNLEVCLSLTSCSAV